MRTPAADLYEADFYAWTQAQARELRRLAATRPNVPLDLPHLAEEIADLGKDRRDALRSWARRVIEHLLLLEHSPARDPRSHREGEIAVFRNDIRDRLSKTLRRDLQRRLPQLYEDARRVVERKMGRHGEHASGLPEACPYTLEQVLEDWWPEEGGAAQERKTRGPAP